MAARLGQAGDSHWVYRSPGYRCRHGHTSARAPAAGRPKNMYVRQDAAIAYAAAELGLPLDSPEQAAYQLRATQLTIICTSSAMTLQDIEETEVLPTQT